MKRRVAITGFGVVSPIGSGRDAFFSGLRRASAGIDQIRSFDASGFASRLAGEVKDLDLARLEWPGPERTALQRDRKSAFALHAAREALNMAFGGERPSLHYAPERVATALGAGLEVFHLADLVPYLEPTHVAAAPLLAATHAAPPGSFLQMPSDLGARCIARLADAAGPFSVNVSACAAGTQALGEAYWLIADGAADAALSGGYDSMINPLGIGGFCLLQAMSTRNDLRGQASRPFDAGRDGFVLGEGAAVFVLEELALAKQRGATILGEVMGFGSTLDAFRVTDPAPGHAGAVQAMQEALDAAELTPSDIDYINAHGTGTRLNDPAETAAIHTAFGESARHVPVSSTKSQIGHLIGAAGAVELVAVLFAMLEETLPATINLSTPDPECDLDYVPNVPRRARVRFAMSNSFGFGGQNAVLVVGNGSPIGRGDAR